MASSGDYQEPLVSGHGPNSYQPSSDNDSYQFASDSHLQHSVNIYTSDSWQPVVLTHRDSNAQSPVIKAAVRHIKPLLVLALASIIGLTVTVVLLALRNQSLSSQPPSPPLTGATCTTPYSTGTNGMVSTTHTLATEAGLSILRKGGNAFDAAAAIQFALNVVQPQSTGIGGGCFVMFYHAASRKYYALDGREEAPEAFSEDAFCVNKTQCGQWPNGNNDYCGCRTSGAYAFRDRSTGGHPVGVPGVLRTMERMLSEYGTMSISDTLQPAIQLADNGFPMYYEMRNRLLLNADRMTQWPATKKLFFPNSGGRSPINIGDTFKNPDLATTFRTIASSGVNFFYTGSLAREVVTAAQNAINKNTSVGGLLTLTDMSRYRAVYRTPIVSIYRNYSLVGMAAPSSGGLSMAMMLNHLELFEMPTIQPLSGEWFHRVIDAQDIAFSDRARYIADADWFDVPVDDLLSKDYAKARGKQLSRALESARVAAGGSVPVGEPWQLYNTNTGVSEDSGVQFVSLTEKSSSSPSPSPSLSDYYSRFGLAPPSDKKGTTHLVVADRFGNLVSMTTTIEENFGSGVVVPNRGFLLNNELTDFTALPADSNGLLYANRPEGGTKPRKTATTSKDQNSVGGKRPMSSMAPTIVYRTSDKKPVLAIGSPGGSAIIGTVLNGLVNVLDGGMCISDAIAAPRIISQNGLPQAEDGFYDSKYTNDRAVLASRNFSVVRLVTERPLGFLEALTIDNSGHFQGAGDQSRLSVAGAGGY